MAATPRVLREAHVLAVTERLQGDGVGLGSTVDAGVEGVDRRELTVGQLEVGDVEVLGDPCRPGRLGIAERLCWRCQRRSTHRIPQPMEPQLTAYSLWS